MDWSHWSICQEGTCTPFLLSPVFSYFLVSVICGTLFWLDELQTPAATAQYMHIWDVELEFPGILILPKRFLAFQETDMAFVPQAFTWDRSTAQDFCTIPFNLEYSTVAFKKPNLDNKMNIYIKPFKTMVCFQQYPPKSSCFFTCLL